MTDGPVKRRGSLRRVAGRVEEYQAARAEDRVARQKQAADAQRAGATQQQQLMTYVNEWMTRIEEKIDILLERGER